MTTNYVQNLLTIVNQAFSDTMIYYNVSNGFFEYHNEDDSDNQDLILTPCVFYLKREIRIEFYSMLNDEELAIAQSYYYKRGYFNYLIENGLYEVYKAAEETVCVKAAEAFFNRYNISVPSQAIEINCCFL